MLFSAKTDSKINESNVLISTGGLDEQIEYEIIDAIFAIDSHRESLLKAADPNEAFEGVKNALRARCAKLGGHAVINCQFEYRVAVDPGIITNKQVIEIFAYGTAVRIK